MDMRELLNKQVKAFDLSKSARGKHRLLSDRSADIFRETGKEVRDIHDLGMPVIAAHQLLRFFGELRGEHRKVIYIPIAVSEAAHIFALEVMVMVQLGNLYNARIAVF